MAQHQQKLVQITTLTSVGAAGAQLIATGFLINADNNPSLAVPRDETTVEVIGGDPSGTYRWWTTGITTVGFTLNWAGTTPGVNLRVVSHIFHSICFDITSQVKPY